MNPLVTRRAGRLGAVLVLSIVAGACGDAGDAGISVDDAWARPTAPAVPVGAVYMTLESPADDVLVGASVSPAIAARVTIHRTETADGSSTMRALGELDLPAGEPVAIEPGGNHLMLEGLGAPLVDGSTFEITLDFATAPDQVVTVDVRSGET